MNIGIDVRPALRAKTGVGNYVLNLVLSLIDLKRENQYHLFSNSFRDRFSLQQIHDLANWHIRDFRFPNLFMNYLWNHVGGFPINRLLDGIEVFHFTGAIAPRLEGISTVASVYDLYHLRHPEWVEKKHRVALHKWKDNLAGVSKIICISAFTKKDLVDFLGIPPEKIEVIPLGVNSGVFKPMNKQDCDQYLKTRFQLEGEFLLYVGTLETKKNLPQLIEAFRIVLARHPHLKLVMVGDPGKGFEEIQKKSRSLGLEKSIRRLGYLDADQNLPYLYCGALAFVLPSLYEGFGLPLLEAFACETPVAASNCTAIPEVTGDAALLFDPYQPEDIAAKILQILDDRDLARTLKEKASVRAKTFTWADTAKKTLKVYESLRPCR